MRLLASSHFTFCLCCLVASPVPDEVRVDADEDEKRNRVFPPQDCRHEERSPDEGQNQVKFDCVHRGTTMIRRSAKVQDAAIEALNLAVNVFCPGVSPVSIVVRSASAVATALAASMS